MKIAIPTAEGKLCMHFGHCRVFAIVEADESTGEILSVSEQEPPPHEPGALPKWLNEQGVGIVIAGGMGMRAQQFFRDFGIEVLVGAPSEDPETVAAKYLADSLETGGNVCDH
jgi:predicted Fe-Mo cluster-binding NifX family protein